MSDNVITFPGKKDSDPHKVSELLKNVLVEITDNLNEKDLKEFNQYLMFHHPDLSKMINGEQQVELSLDFNIDQLVKDIELSQEMLDESFNYLKEIERDLFIAATNADADDVQLIRDDLKKLYEKLQKKVDSIR